MQNHAYKIFGKHIRQMRIKRQNHHLLNAQGFHRHGLIAQRHNLRRRGYATFVRKIGFGIGCKSDNGRRESTLVRHCHQAFQNRRMPSVHTIEVADGDSTGCRWFRWTMVDVHCVINYAPPSLRATFYQRSNPYSIYRLDSDGLLRGESARNDGGFVKSSSLVLFAQMWKQQHIAYVWIVGKQHHQAV